MAQIQVERLILMRDEDGDTHHEDLRGAQERVAAAIRRAWEARSRAVETRLHVHDRRGEASRRERPKE